MKLTRITKPTMTVLDIFLKNFNEELSGADISKNTEIMSGTLYPILRRFEKMGWASSRWEEADPSAIKRPRRRLYKLSAKGRFEAQAAIAKRKNPNNAPIFNEGQVPIQIRGSIND